MRKLVKRTKTVEGDPLISIMALVAMLIPMLLYGAVFVKFVTLDVNSPTIDRPGKEPPKEELQLTVFITDQGFHFKVNPERRQPWMAQAADGSGPDIPRTGDGWDFDALADRLKELKRDNRGERSIIFGAEDDIDFDILIEAMDYARGSDEEQLFPDVTLTRGVV
ncbi:MAG: biopolymer transporter ExbD [Deltaproteobacteria bacterium]|nr:biopolymer transporter ExbD [Deltaproteobacteria bacterium]